MGYDADAASPLEYYQRAAASIGEKFDRMLNLAKRLLLHTRMREANITYFSP
jgi:hypothetical protein